MLRFDVVLLLLVSLLIVKLLLLALLFFRCDELCKECGDARLNGLLIKVLLGLMVLTVLMLLVFFVKGRISFIDELDDVM